MRFLLERAKWGIYRLLMQTFDQYDQHDDFRPAHTRDAHVDRLELEHLLRGKPHRRRRQRAEGGEEQAQSRSTGGDDGGDSNSEGADSGDNSGDGGDDAEAPRGRHHEQHGMTRAEHRGQEKRILKQKYAAEMESGSRSMKNAIIDSGTTLLTVPTKVHEYLNERIPDTAEEAIHTPFCPLQENFRIFILRGLRNISEAP
jgi:hypothetical protein